MPVQTQMQVRRGTASSWTSTNPTLAAGELGFETDTGKFKIGNGSSTWTALLYAGGGQSSLTTYQYTATAGQTTFSGADVNSNTLSYTVGAIQVYLNGALLANTTDYAATNGTSVVLTGGAGLGDSLTIISFATFDVANTYTQAQADALFIADTIVDAKGDIIAATAADTVSRLTVGANDTVLTADSSTATGLKWAAPGVALSYTLLNTGGTALSTSSTSITGISGYSNLLILVSNASSTSASAQVFVTINNQNAGGDYDCAASVVEALGTYAAANFADRSDIGADHIRLAVLSSNAASACSGTVRIDGANGTGKKAFTSIGAASAAGGNSQENYAFQGIFNGSATISSIQVKTNSGTFDAGRVYVWGA
jgi:hypothetical protein